MKIVIDLPKEVTEWFKERAFIPIKYYTEVEEAMEKAEPLSEILDKISAEIDEKISHYEHFSSSNTANGLMIAKEIIEKYKGESEC